LRRPPVADFFRTDEVVKGYNGKIVRRILSYLKPYRSMAVAALAALALSTLGELFVPLLQQRLIDNNIAVRFLVFRDFPGPGDLSGKSREALEIFRGAPGAIAAGGRLFIPMGKNTRFPPGAEEELKEKGILLDEDWYAFRYEPGGEEEALVKRRGDIFIDGEGTAAARKKDLYSLPLNEIRIARSADIAFIVRGFFLLLFVLVLVFFLTFVQTWTTSLMGQRIMKDIRLELFRKTASRSSAFISRHPVGRLVTRLTGDVETINEFFTSVLSAFLKDISVMAGALVTLFALSPKLGAVTLLTLPPVLAVTALSRVKARDAFRRQRTASSRVNSYLSERLMGIQVVQLFLGEKKSGEEFKERSGELLKANLGEMHVFALFRPLVEWFSTLTTAVIIVAGSAMVLDLSLSLGVLIAFISLVGMFFSPVQDIAEKYTLLQSAMAGGERVFALLDSSEEIPDSGKTVIEGRVGGTIEFKNVCFSYKQGEEILKGLSFRVERGETAAIVGYTGAGKTTITNVLTRLWDIDSGEIRLDGIPVKDIPLRELRRSCLPALQEVFLFSGTVADNIRLGLPLSDGEVEAAARAVHAHEFISAMSEGYKTVLSEGASNISSGQRQLISFARVIAHNPAVVILDEATSSVDTETERLIQLGIQRVLAGRTSLVIAHRLSTIRHADRILVLSGGRVAEEGRHEELIARNGLYAGLYRLQYENNEERVKGEEWE
jgi:ATP-binding cassette subfamily B protein